MAPKARSASARGGRGSAKKATKPAGATRNITRWSANKDIVLLCALTKECRRDKFQPSWDRVAAWIGPNVTGAAVEQHIGKLYSKLTQHRAVRGPTPKKKKAEAEEDSQDDFAVDDDAWGKGNEALANIFYDKPGINSAGFMQDASDDELEMVAGTEQLAHKRSIAGKSKMAQHQGGGQAEQYGQGGPSDLLLTGTKYLGGGFPGEAENSPAGYYHHPGASYGAAGSEMGYAGHGGILAAQSGNLGAFENVNSSGELVVLPSRPAMTPAGQTYGMQSIYRPESTPSTDRTIPNSVALGTHVSSGRGLPDFAALESETAETYAHDPHLLSRGGDGNNLPPVGIFHNRRYPPMPIPSGMTAQSGNGQMTAWAPISQGVPMSDRVAHYELASHGGPSSYNSNPFGQQTDSNLVSAVNSGFGGARGGLEMQQLNMPGNQNALGAQQPGGRSVRRVLFPKAKNTGPIIDESLQPGPGRNTRMPPQHSIFTQLRSNPAYSPSNIAASLRRESLERRHAQATSPIDGHLHYGPAPDGPPVDLSPPPKPILGLASGSPTLAMLVAAAAAIESSPVGRPQDLDEEDEDENDAGEMPAWDELDLSAEMEGSPN